MATLINYFSNTPNFTSITKLKDLKFPTALIVIKNLLWSGFVDDWPKSGSWSTRKCKDRCPNLKADSERRDRSLNPSRHRLRVRRRITRRFREWLRRRVTRMVTHTRRPHPRTNHMKLSRWVRSIDYPVDGFIVFIVLLGLYYRINTFYDTNYFIHSIERTIIVCTL